MKIKVKFASVTVVSDPDRLYLIYHKAPEYLFLVLTEKHLENLGLPFDSESFTDKKIVLHFATGEADDLPNFRPAHVFMNFDLVYREGGAFSFSQSAHLSMTSTDTGDPLTIPIKKRTFRRWSKTVSPGTRFHLEKIEIM